LQFYNIIISFHPVFFILSLFVFSLVSLQQNGKLLADAMEALVGAFYVDGGVEVSLAFLRHVGLADCPLDKVTQYVNPTGASVTAPATNSGGITINNDIFIPGLFSTAPISSSSYLRVLDISQVEAALGGYKFKNQALVQEALTHGSVLGQRCYQRLEFLGDCILDLVLLKTAYKAYRSDISPAQLHDIRSITLNAERLALAAVRAHLQTHICYHSAALFRQIDEYVVEAESAVRNADKECDLGSIFEGNQQQQQQQQQQNQQKNNIQYNTTGTAPSSSSFSSSSSLSSAAWDDVMVRYAFGLDRICAPKVLSDITEALMGAVWLDSQGNWEVTTAVVMHLLSPLPWIDEEVVMKEGGSGYLVHIPPHPVRRIHVSFSPVFSIYFQEICILGK
jgi:dsRNA-specific ribonuclease